MIYVTTPYRKELEELLNTTSIKHQHPANFRNYLNIKVCTQEQTVIWFYNKRNLTKDLVSKQEFIDFINLLEVGLSFSNAYNLVKGDES